MRVPMRNCVPIVGPHNGLGARSAPGRHWLTSQGLCRDIKGRSLDWSCGGWQFHHELAAAARPVAVCCDGASVELDELRGDGETDSQPSLEALPALGEELEDLRQHVSRYALSGIRHTDLY